MSAWDAVARLLTFVDINDVDDGGPDGCWSETQLVLGFEERSEQDRRRYELEFPGIWTSETVEEIARTARDVVGPDEPFDGHTQADMEADHWNALVRVLEQEGVAAEPAELERLPHDVELSDRVLARIGHGRPATASG